MIAALPKGAAVLIESDAYYRDRSALPGAEREHINYDHPDAIETEFLEDPARRRAARGPRHRRAPVRDYREHARRRETRRVEPAPVIVVEGILVLADERLRAQMDLKIFVDTDADVRLMRRMGRDMEERGRTFAQVREQYSETVRPMHLAFVEPSKRFADLVVPEGGQNQPALDAIVGRLLQTLV